MSRKTLRPQGLAAALLILSVPVFSAGFEGAEAPIELPAADALALPGAPAGVYTLPAGAPLSIPSAAELSLPTGISLPDSLPSAAALPALKSSAEAGPSADVRGAFKGAASEDLKSLEGAGPDSDSSEALRERTGRFFDASAARGSDDAPVAAAVPVEAPRAPRTVNPTGKEETAGHLPIHRPDEDGGTHEPGLYSPSRLSEFEWDREQYAMHWVMGHKNTDPKVIEAFGGGIAHQTMENLERWLTGGKSIDSIQLKDVLEVYHTLWAEQYVPGKYKLAEGKTEKEYEQYYETFVRGVWDQFYPFDQGSILMFERKLMYTVEDSGTGQKYRFQGIPDLVLMIRRPNGRKLIRIVDWKTTTSPKTQDQLLKHDYQLGMYVMALEQNFPDLTQDADFELQWRYKDFPQTIAVTPELKEQVRDRVLRVLHEIEVYTAQVDANRDEWEKRINPDKPVKGMKEASQLVDQWTELSSKKDALKKQLKDMEEQEEELIERLLAFAKKTGNTTISGASRDAVLKESDAVQAPTKTGDAEGYRELAQLIKAAGLWEQFSSLDLSEVKEMAKVAGHPHHALYEKIKHLVSVKTKQDLKLKKKQEEKA